MTILITGGAGFIGSVTCRKLLRLKYNVISLDNFDDFYSKNVKKNNISEFHSNKNFIFSEGDIRNKDTLEEIFKENKIDIVIHFAAKTGVRPSIENPKTYIDTNIAGTQNILACMKRHNCKNLIFASSSSVYGNNKKVPFSETDNVDFPISPYAATKKSCELLTHTFHHLYNFNVLNLRFFTVYGPRQRPDLAIHKFFNKLYNNLPIEVYGDGNTGRDYTYIDDIVSGIISSIEYILQSKKIIYEIINLGNSKPVLLNELINNIEEVTKKKVVRKEVPLQPGDVNLTYADIKKAKKKLGYNPKTSLKEGLLNFKNWYDKKIIR